MTSPEIIELCKKEFGKSISRDSVHNYKYNPENKVKIQRLREEYTRDLFMVDLASKRKRLERISKIVETCEEYKDYRTALEGLSQIRQEVEKDLASLNMTNYQINVFKDMSEAEIEEERMKSLERIKLLRGALKNASGPNLLGVPNEIREIRETIQ